jgi:hypothetical protein
LFFFFVLFYFFYFIFIENYEKRKVTPVCACPRLCLADSDARTPHRTTSPTSHHTQPHPFPPPRPQTHNSGFKFAPEFSELNGLKALAAVPKLGIAQILLAIAFIEIATFNKVCVHACVR